MKRDHGKHWESTTGLTHMKGFLRGPCAKRTRKLVRIKWEPTETGDGLLTGHCHPNGHIFKLGPVKNTTYERCQDKDETASHVLCDLRLQLT
jgi:hypothetical protein